MSKKATTTTPSSSPTSVGGYVADMRDALIASVVSSQHAVVLGAPGYGKTAIARAMAQGIAENFWTFTRIDPSTPPEVVRGAYDPAALLDGRLERVIAGTPYDPQARIGILDEMFRGNDVTFDTCLDVLDRMDTNPDQAATIWATANFVASGERVEALLDRFGIWIWLSPDMVDVGAIAGTQLASTNGLAVPGNLPNWKTISDIRRATPGRKTTKAVIDLLETLAQEARAQGQHPHPRRATQWAKLVYRLTVYQTGKADPGEVPADAAKALRWAWPAPSSDQAEAWSQIALSIVDSVGAAIEAAMTQALIKFREVAAIKDPSTRMGHMGELGTLLANSQGTLKSISTTDARIEEAGKRLTEWFAAAARGEKPGGAK